MLTVLVIMVKSFANVLVGLNSQRVMNTANVPCVKMAALPPSGEILQPNLVGKNIAKSAALTSKNPNISIHFYNYISNQPRPAPYATATTRPGFSFANFSSTIFPTKQI